MPSHRVCTRPPRTPLDVPPIATDRETLGAFLEDAAHFPGGHTDAVAFPRTEGEVAALVLGAQRILPIGAQSSVTGGATPMGEVVLSTARMTSIVHLSVDRVRVQPGIAISTLQGALAEAGRYYPPFPTYMDAFAGGVVATNASGAGTFKYGSTRGWVETLTVVLASGDVLDLERGQAHAHPDGYFEIVYAASNRLREGFGGPPELAAKAEDAAYDRPAYQRSADRRSGDEDLIVRVPIPTYRMPDVPKRSAGYFAAPQMDLIDLFIGSEGTLGIVTEITFRVLPRIPALALALVPMKSEAAAVALVDTIRRASQQTWRDHDPRGLDVVAIENMDRRCLEMLREDGVDRKHDVTFPDGTAVALLMQLELAPETTPAQAYEDIGAALSASAPDTPLVRFCRLLDAQGVLDATELALPGDAKRRQQLIDVREAIPTAVNNRVGEAKRLTGQAIEKVAADMIVPFEHFGEMLEIYHEGFRRRGLDHAIWGHISDGNVHPNLIPTSLDDVRKGKEAILEFGLEAARRRGCPLAEHGVGRSPVKQALLKQLYGEEGIGQMRAVKRALDPDGKFAPGVLFTDTPSTTDTETA